MRYEYKYIGTVFPVPAQIVGEELQKIKDENGGVLTAKAVLEIAKDPTNILHKCCDFDDVEGSAEKHWLHQINLLISSVQLIKVKVNIMKRAPEKTEVHAFYSRQLISSDGKSSSRVFVSHEDVKENCFLEENFRKICKHLELFILTAEEVGLDDELKHEIQEVKQILQKINKKK
ncbi:MAG: hypothetical protein NTU98_07930 [Bacteroidetes bacterium]|nr:hypothetical protein [Bacteroidota bacterium]